MEAVGLKPQFQPLQIDLSLLTDKNSPTLPYHLKLLLIAELEEAVKVECQVRSLKSLEAFFAQLFRVSRPRSKVFSQLKHNDDKPKHSCGISW